MIASVKEDPDQAMELSQDLAQFRSEVVIDITPVTSPNTSRKVSVTSPNTSRKVSGQTQDSLSRQDSAEPQVNFTFC